MRKLIALFLMAAVVVWTFGPVLTVANGVVGPVGTGLERGTGGGSKPIVKVKWEMLNEVSGDPGVGEAGHDDDTASGAQFMPPSQWDKDLEYTVCAIVTDPNGISDISGVYADIFYPDDRAYSEDPANPDVLGDPDSESHGVGACGEFIEQNTLQQLSKNDGYELFCEQVRDNNNNLPEFASDYDYDDICNPDGELLKEEAYVYCDDKTLKWEDPAGNYTVSVIAQDNAGNNSDPLENDFEYLALTAFEKDFTSINYGQVLLSTPKRISGNLTWNDGIASVRNVGNTRLNMWVAQDDMGLGQSSGEWNVEYDARVGNDEHDWEVYDPFGYKSTTPNWSSDYTVLEDILELSEVEEMDFSIHVKKWPNSNTSFGGDMWLGATFADFRTCG